MGAPTITPITPLAIAHREKNRISSSVLMGYLTTNCPLGFHFSGMRLSSFTLRRKTRNDGIK